MVVRVAPLLRLPRSIGVFDYRPKPETLVRTGDLVSVPFRRRLVPGIVLGTSPRSTIPEQQLKSVSSVLSTAPLLPPDLIQVAHAISAESFTSIATTFRSMLPTFAARKTIAVPPLEPTDAQLHDAIRTALPDQRNIQLLQYTDETRLFSYYRELAQRVSQAHGSLMIIAPTRRRIERLAAQLPTHTIHHHDLPTTALRTVYLDGRSHAKTILIGTRSAIFAPLARLALIIIDDEDAEEHVQENPGPRYDARHIALIRSRATGVPVVLTSRLPSLAAAQAVSTTTLLNPLPKIRSAFIHLDEARRAGDYHIIPEETLTAWRAVGTHLRGLIVHPHRTTFRTLECADCGYVPLCPGCSVPLHQDGLRLHCRHCGITHSLPSSCPRCRGVNLRGRGRGIAHLVAELQRRIPVAVSTDPTRPEHRPSITVITPHQLRDGVNDQFTHACLTRYESLLAIPRYDADELARRTIAAMAGVLEPDGLLIVQGGQTAKTALQTLWRDAWRTDVLRQRERYGYPPRWHFVYLRRRTNARTTGVSVERLTTFLRRSLPSADITGPYRSLGRSRVDPSGTSFVVRFRKKLPAAVQTFLQHLDESWTIAPDPITTS